MKTETEQNQMLNDYAQELWESDRELRITLKDVPSQGLRLTAEYDTNTGHIVFGMPVARGLDGKKQPLPKGMVPARVRIPAIDLQQVMAIVVDGINRELEYQLTNLTNEIKFLRQDLDVAREDLADLVKEEIDTCSKK
jgi:hypothetical protein